MKPNLNEVKCNKCGWLHFTWSLEKTLQNIEDFNKYFESLPAEVQKNCYGNQRSKLHKYTHCMRCGNIYTNFSTATKEDGELGTTLNPLLAPEVDIVKVLEYIRIWEPEEYELMNISGNDSSANSQLTELAKKRIFK